MESNSKDERKRIFLSELQQLEEEEYITSKQYHEIARAHQQYYYDLRIEQDEKSKPVVFSDKPTSKKPIVVVTTPKKKTEKKKLSADEVRERNITWSLYLGVILLLIGGLFVATSNWETMENWSKSGIIGLVALLFFGISYLSKKVLKIEQTGFAFIILGSLFLPIFLLSLGWFELLGEYLSLTGEGRYVFGLISCLLLMPIYASFARKLSSRLFVWFTYLDFSIGAAFVIASIGLEKDWFYFGMMLFNIITVLLFHRIKKLDGFKLFTKEMVAFAQIQLVLTSLLMLVFFENHLINGINLFISAAIYLAMVYVSGRKEYHFIFTAMIVYGAYQFIEHSVLDELGPVLYVLVGIGFLGIPKILDNQTSWNNVFQLTSAVVSGLVFIAISFESLVIKMNEPSVALCLAYLLLACQFLYLANVVNSRILFSYLSPVFFLASFYEILLMLDEYFHFENFILPIFFIGFLLFMIFGGFSVKVSQLAIIRNSSRDLGIGTMLAAVWLSFVFSYWLNLGIMLCLLSLVLFLSMRIEERTVYKESAPWLISIFTAVAFAAFGEEWRVSSWFYETNLGFAMNAVIGSLAVFLACYGWKRMGETRLSNYSYYVGLFCYTIAIPCALLYQVNEQWMKPLVLLVGIAIFSHFYFVQKFKWLPYVIGFLTLVWYFTVLNSIYLQVEVPLQARSLEFALGGALLLLICYFVKNKGPSIANGYAWVAHVYLPPALLLTFFLYAESSIWSFLLSMGLYAISTYLVKVEWKIKALLYGAFTSLFFVILAGLMKYTEGIESHYAFLITSGLIIFYWLLTNSNYKVRTMYYFVPFSILGITAFLMNYPFGLTLYLITLLYSLVVLLFLHIQKWDFGTILPLLFLFAATMQYLQLEQMEEAWQLFITAGIGVILIVLGRFLYKELFQTNEKGWIIQFDSYTFTAFVFFGSCYLFQPDLLWGNLIPGVLISCSLWLQKSRTPESWSMWVTLIAGVYLLEPYYSLMFDLTIPDLWEREVLVLPGLVVVIFLRLCLGVQYRKLTNQLQWAMLVIISLILVQDGVESSTIYDALILGTLSLLSMLMGMFLKVKSYFFVGAGVLLLNVFLQTRPLWGNLPWWGYLLLAGSILITVASYHEWHKQKVARGEDTLLTVLKQKILAWFKKWE